MKRIASIAEKHGASIPEFLILDMTDNGMAEDEAVQVAKQCHPSVTKQAVLRCLQKGWLLRCGGNVYITRQGKRVAEGIASGLAATVRRRRPQAACGTGPAPQF
jgi:hypothetical protein